MALVRWEPFQELNELQQEMNRLFDTVSRPNYRRPANGSFVPAAEIEEAENELHLRLEVPGLKAEDLDIQVTAEAVSVRGERKSETKTEENGVTRTEFRYGQFQRVLPLPVRVSNTDVTAEYKDGILHLTLPKAEEEKNKVVKVNVGKTIEGAA